MDLIITILPVVTKDLPISPRLGCKYKTSLLWMLQNTPHEVYVHIGCESSLYLFEDLCMVPILPNKMRVIASFIGRLTW